jgi:hypothetical protein
MGLDEAGTRALLNDYKRIMTEVITRYRGRIVSTARLFVGVKTTLGLFSGGCIQLIWALGRANHRVYHNALRLGSAGGPECHLRVTRSSARLGYPRLDAWRGTRGRLKRPRCGSRRVVTAVDLPGRPMAKCWEESGSRVARPLKFRVLQSRKYDEFFDRYSPHRTGASPLAGALSAKEQLSAESHQHANDRDDQRRSIGPSRGGSF